MDTAYTSPPECIDLRDIEINTVIVGECNSQTDSFELKIGALVRQSMESEPLVKCFLIGNSYI